MVVILSDAWRKTHRCRRPENCFFSNFIGQAMYTLVHSESLEHLIECGRNQRSFDLCVISGQGLKEKRCP